MTRGSTRFLPSTIAFFALCGSALVAGDLTPPAGPVLSTMKNLQDVEPRISINAANTPGDANSVFQISAPGSYYLTANIDPVAGFMAIEVLADGVTIDLNGFRVSAATGFAAVFVDAFSASGFRIHNGSVTGPGNGLLLQNTFGADISNIRISGSTGSGILSGSSAVITECTAIECLAVGIGAGAGSVVSRCTAADNTNAGIFGSGLGVTISDCNTFSNTGPGILIQNSRGIVSRCSSSFNDGDGVQVNSDCAVLDCILSGNGNGAASGAGVHAIGADNRIEGNNCTDNDIGIDVDVAGNLIIRNSASGNTTNFSIVAGNFTGTIVATEAAMNAATNSNVNVAF